MITADIQPRTVLQANQTTGPVFLVGVWRSGTSLLQTLLNQHSQIGLMYEADLPLLSALFWGTHPKSDWLERWNFWNSALTRHRIDRQALSSGPADLRSAAETIYREYAAQNGKPIFGEKSPNYWDSLDSLSRTFPSARFIVIWRNPLGICRSVVSAAQNEPYFAKRGMLLRALLGCRKLKQQRDRLVARGVPVHELHYEDLIRDPLATLRALCAFLGVPLETRMVSLEHADRGSLYEGQHHSLVKGDKIVASGSQRPENLHRAFRGKIDRYIALWRQESHGAFPVHIPATAVNAHKPGFGERLKDSLSLWLLRRLDASVALAFCWAPMPLLKAWRARKRSSGVLLPAGDDR